MQHLSLIAALLLPTIAEASDMKTLKTSDGTTLEYMLVLPADYDPRETYPTVLALPPGGQDRGMVEAIVSPWEYSWAADGWIVVSPVAPSGKHFYGPGLSLLPELLDHVSATYNIADEKVHLFGISNGGRSAFAVGLAHPERFSSMLVIPGMPSGDEWEQLERLKPMRVTLVVGSEDSAWTDGSQKAAETLKAAGVDVKLVVVEDQGHMVFKTVGYTQLKAWLTR